MYISKRENKIYTMELNQIEYNVIKKMIDKLIFNPDNVSNYFKVTSKEADIVRHFQKYMHGMN
jgi:hypothetical protein